MIMVQESVCRHPRLWFGYHHWNRIQGTL